MELLPEGKKNNIQVTLEDQKKINEFSKLILRKDSLEVELAKERQEKEYLDDVSLELELFDEEEKVQYKIGDVFVYLKQGKVLEQIEKDTEIIDSKIDNLEERQNEIDSKLKELKTQLYAKFGDNINLER
ncbi:prefoldin subunit 4 [Monosporozyma unispora]|nr:Prefoldin subunit 4 [Kazachstania unispora]